MERKKVDITVWVLVDISPDIVWRYWNNPAHIVGWNSASDDWHTTNAINDLRVGGYFSSRMEAKDHSMGFDFEGRYDEVVPNKKIAYTLADGRKVKVVFTEVDDKTEITETFDAEGENPVELQREGWQAILNRFKHYVESNEKQQ
ncbi:MULTISPECIES: SRPBCC family protein [unclassified Dysgonomonas]|uniref:SRPBCC family protein n=1 Tax=unclassified Dysgonomonas TaxID=2630389 RepID=UPI0013E9F13D|nr:MULTISPECIES: SRPBCC family protein [unclassified Dysgonomonas]